MSSLFFHKLNYMRFDFETCFFGIIRLETARLFQRDTCEGPYNLFNCVNQEHIYAKDNPLSSLQQT